jgi:transposase
MGSGRSYTAEFKNQAVELADRLGSTSKAAKQLGISDVNIHVWRKKQSIGSGTAAHAQQLNSVEQDELKRLRKEVLELKQVNMILKSAAAFFSQDHLKKNMI